MTSRYSVWCLTILLGFVLVRSEPFGPPIALWTDGAPDEPGDIGEEHDKTPKGKDDIVRLTNVTEPEIVVFKPDPRRDTGVAVVVCPGGGYNILAMNLEGTEIVKWLNSIGVTGVLLKYRVPRRKDREKHAAPLQDLQRAMGIVRHQADEFRIDPNRIGVMGFSAGAHLAAALSNNYDQRTYAPIDEIDRVSCRPEFAMLIYPAYLTVEDENDRIAPELRVTTQTPPTILIQTQDDVVRVESSVFYYLALKNANVPAEMHLYPVGGHGYGLRRSGDLVATWPNRCEDWLRAGGIIPR